MFAFEVYNKIELEDVYFIMVCVYDSNVRFLIVMYLQIKNWYEKYSELFTFENSPTVNRWPSVYKCYYLYSLIKSNSISFILFIQHQFLLYQLH